MSSYMTELTSQVLTLSGGNPGFRAPSRFSLEMSDFFVYFALTVPCIYVLFYVFSL